MGQGMHYAGETSWCTLSTPSRLSWIGAAHVRRRKDRGLAARIPLAPDPGVVQQPHDEAGPLPSCDLARQ